MCVRKAAPGGCGLSYFRKKSKIKNVSNCHEKYRTLTNDALDNITLYFAVLAGFPLKSANEK